jgi:hypothetical protein
MQQKVNLPRYVSRFSQPHAFPIPEIEVVSVSLFLSALICRRRRVEAPHSLARRDILRRTLYSGALAAGGIAAVAANNAGFDRLD